MNRAQNEIIVALREIGSFSMNFWSQHLFIGTLAEANRKYRIMARQLSQNRSTDMVLENQFIFFNIFIIFRANNIRFYLHIKFVCSGKKNKHIYK